MTPRSMALAYRIWAYAEPKGWDCSVQEIGDALGESWQSIYQICRYRDWWTRLRKDAPARGSEMKVDLGESYAPPADLNVSMWFE